MPALARPGKVIEATPSPSRRGLKHKLSGDPGRRTARSNTVPIEKGTETSWSTPPAALTASEATPSPSRRGLKLRGRTRRQSPHIIEATPSPSRRGLKRLKPHDPRCNCRGRSNTVPIEKGTETVDVHDLLGRHREATPSPSRRGLKHFLIPRAAGPQLAEATPSPSRRGLKPDPRRSSAAWCGPKQHRPHREGD